jgi:hypothetical protein
MVSSNCRKRFAWFAISDLSCFSAHPCSSSYLAVALVQSFFGLGGGGLKVDIILQDAVKPGQQQQDQPPVPNDQVVPMHHTPSWKLRKNPFFRVGNTVVPAMNEMGVPAICAYEAAQDVGGKVLLTLPPGKKADHLGIKIQFIGRIDMVRFTFVVAGL